MIKSKGHVEGWIGHCWILPSGAVWSKGSATNGAIRYAEVNSHLLTDPV